MVRQNGERKFAARRRKPHAGGVCSPGYPISIFQAFEHSRAVLGCIRIRLIWIIVNRRLFQSPSAQPERMNDRVLRIRVEMVNHSQSPPFLLPAGPIRSRPLAKRRLVHQVHQETQMPPPTIAFAGYPLAGDPTPGFRPAPRSSSAISSSPTPLPASNGFRYATATAPGKPPGIVSIAPPGRRPRSIVACAPPILPPPA